MLDYRRVGGDFKHFFIFTPRIGEDEPILTNIFQMGWFNHQLEKIGKGWNWMLLEKIGTKKVGKKTKTFSFL